MKKMYGPKGSVAQIAWLAAGAAHSNAFAVGMAASDGAEEGGLPRRGRDAVVEAAVDTAFEWWLAHLAPVTSSRHPAILLG